MAGVLYIRDPETGEFAPVPVLVGPPGPGVPAGGAAGQVLVKSGEADHETQWRTLTADDVSALAVGGTAADSSKLGGKSLAEIMLALYPVGAVYISANSTSPASLFGGTWEQIKDRFLLGAGNTYTAGSAGGANAVKITKSNLPNYSMDLECMGLKFAHDHIGTTGDVNYYGVHEIKASATSVATFATVSTGGGGEAHNNMPPYLAVYMWKRVR